MRDCDFAQQPDVGFVIDYENVVRHAWTQTPKLPCPRGANISHMLRWRNTENGDPYPNRENYCGGLGEKAYSVAVPNHRFR